MAGRRLNDEEIESYDLVPPELARRVRILKVPFIPGGYAGMTLGRTVLLAKEVDADGRSPLMAHELVHVRQWQEQGVLGFSRGYLGSFARNLASERRWQAAYRLVDAEVEARESTQAWIDRKMGHRRPL